MDSNGVDDEGAGARRVSGNCQEGEGLGQEGGRRWRLLLLTLVLVAVGVAGVVVVHPLNSMVMRLALVGCVVMAWVGMVVGEGWVAGVAGSGGGSGDAAGRGD